MRSALIFGATSDVAMALAEGLAQRGYALILTGRDSERLADIAVRCERAGSPNVKTVPIDLLDRDEVMDFLAHCDPLPTMCLYAAGHMANESASIEEIERVFTVNSTMACLIAETIVRRWDQAVQPGILIGISSIAGVRGRSSNYAYGAAKAAFLQYLSGMRSRYRGRIRVVSVVPGFVRTRMIEGIKTPKILTVSPELLARRILAGVDREQDVIYSQWIWRWIALILLVLPEPIFKRLSL